MVFDDESFRENAHENVYCLLFHNHTTAEAHLPSVLLSTPGIDGYHRLLPCGKFLACAAENRRIRIDLPFFGLVGFSKLAACPAAKRHRALSSERLFFFAQNSNLRPEKKGGWLIRNQLCNFKPTPNFVGPWQHTTFKR